MADCFSLPNAAELVEKLRNYSAIADDIRYAVLMKRAADAIEALLVENAKLKAERDAAMRDLKESSDCEFCKYNENYPVFCEKSPNGDECMGKRWEWRGVNHD